MFAAVTADMEGAYEEALGELASGIAIAEEIEDRPLLVEGHLRKGFILYNMGDLEQADAEFKRCSSLAEELGTTRDKARASVALAVITYLRGDIDAAEELAEQTRDWLERTGETFFQIQNLISLAQYALARDDPATAEERLREALPVALDEDTWYVAEIYRLLVETLIRLGRVNDAAELAAFAGRGTQDQHPYVRAAALMGEASIASAFGNIETSVQRYEQAIDLLEDLGLPIELSQARIAYGRALHEAGDSAAAREQFEAAQVACERMGATALLVDVKRELALIGTGAG
jgi:tetratricopeptide (TPR) repeat protein